MAASELIKFRYLTSNQSQVPDNEPIEDYKFLSREEKKSQGFFSAEYY